MGRMEFLTKNILDTTAMLTLDTNTDGAVYLFDRLPNKRYETVDYTASTSATIVIDFGVTTSFSRIAIQNHNLKQFRVYYNGVSATAITLTTGDTTTSVWSTNSATNHYLIFSSIQATSLSIQVDIAMDAGDEKKIGELWVMDLKTRVEKNPTTSDYKASIYNKQIRHEMSDGGVAVYDIQDKFRGEIKFSYVSTPQRSSFKTIYDAKDDFSFVPLGTGTAWDGYIWNVVWVGNYEFIKPQGNTWNTVGWTGKIRLEEISL